ncbi:MAG: hypothetical protein DRQ02_02675 [Candidatus Latescibacterota bacterium]|nr:MAG: hypothetical protein DRQ02_02675 [Candidatus Latescibacterota bacterium]
MRVRSVDTDISKLPGDRPLTTSLPRATELDIVKTPRGRRTGDATFDPLEVQAWPKGQRFLNQRASLPERRVIWWLLYRAKLRPGIDFNFQNPYLGGRILHGGLVSDFDIYTIVPGHIVIWEVQGTTWHKAAWKQQKDEARRVTLLAMKEIFAVINLRESDINRGDAERDRLCESAWRLIDRG